jgi:hypothetical protein
MIRLAPIALMACAACTPTTDTPPAAESPAATDPTTGAQCDATAVQSLVGQTADAATIERARSTSGARTVRSYNTGDAVTQDFRPDRLNVERGADGKIVRLTCG